MATKKLSLAEVAQLKLKALGELCGPSGPFTIGLETVRGITFRCYKKGPKTLLEFFTEAFENHSEKTYLIYNEERYTYNQVFEAASALGHELVTKFGIKKGDRVAIDMRNYPEWCISCIAIASIGAITVALNSWWSEPEVEYGLTDCGASVLICDGNRLLRAVSSLRNLPSLKHCILVRSDIPINLNKEVEKKIILFKDVIKHGNGKKFPKSESEIHTDDVVFILYTSGTTGHPKGVALTNRAIMNQTINFSLSMEMEKRFLPPESSLPFQESIILPVPLFHVVGLVHIFLACTGRGGKVCLLYRWDPEKVLELIAKEKVTQWSGVPTMLQDLMESPSFKKTDLSSLRRVGGGGAPVPPAQVPKISSYFPAEAAQGYGLTETTGGIAGISGEIYLLKPTSTGPPLPIVEIKVIDEKTAKELPPGQRGELVVKSSMVMKEYWNKPQATEKAIISINGDPGWFRTGDIAVVDADGFIHVVDRSKDIIIRGGENISCTEVESAFFHHPSVMECAAVPVPHPRLGEVVGLVVVLKTGHVANASDLIAVVKGKLADFKIPDVSLVFFSSSPLPRGATDKIAKLQLRELVAKILSARKSKL